MTAPNPTRQKAALATLDNLLAEWANVWVIHYSCESFYDRREGRSPRITSIALRKLDSAQTVSFSIHQIAERQGKDNPFVEIEGHYNDLEKEMLTDYSEHLANHQGMKYLHWNMRDVNYGFQAIEHRSKVLGVRPHVISDDKKFDLARLLVDIYGFGYIAHPRMKMLLTKNHISSRDFLTGGKEAKAFEARDFVALHQSTLRKVEVIADFAVRAHDRRLKTDTTWWEMHGGRVRTFVNWIVEHKTLAFLMALVGIALTIVSCLWGR